MSNEIQTKETLRALKEFYLLKLPSGYCHTRFSSFMLGTLVIGLISNIDDCVCRIRDNNNIYNQKDVKEIYLTQLGE